MRWQQSRRATDLHLWDLFEKKSKEWRDEYPSMIKVTGESEEETFETWFLCQFILFRKVFFNAFIRNYDAKDYPTQIDLSNLTEDNEVSVKDLKLFQQVMLAQVDKIELDELERTDRLVDTLGFDKHRHLYFMNSRNALSSTDQQNA